MLPNSMNKRRVGAASLSKRLLIDRKWLPEFPDSLKEEKCTCLCPQAFSAVGAMQAAHWVATGESLSFSEQQLVDCSWMYGSNSGCGGGWMEPALDYVLAQGGAASEETYPYLGQNGYCR